MSKRNRISIEEFRRSLGRVAREVEGGSTMVVERRGQEAFALVPMRLYGFLEEERRKLIESTETARESFSDLPADEVEELLAEETQQSGYGEQKPSSPRSSPRSAAG